MTRGQAVEVIAQAVRRADSAYWAACDAEGKAIDPDDLGAPAGLLDDAYEAALIVEDVAAHRGMTWAEARELV